MNQIVECVPNFSEGRDLGVIEKITDEIKKINGVELLDVDPGKDTNRTVVTMAGEPNAVVEAAFQAIKKAAELIDMSKHTGAHARMGATDVCPFVPVSGITMEECVELSKKLGKRVGKELKIPVYLYAEAAQKESRRRLPDIREGEYEALSEKLKTEDFKPDFGEAVFNKTAGVTAIGARGFLIAYNINLNTKNTKIANNIAKRIREKGRTVKNKETGKKETIPGTLKGVQGMGWYIEEYNMAQITVNILDYKITPVYKVFEECERFATEFGVRVTGSELVGLVPLEAMLDTGKHVIEKQGGSIGVSEEEIVRIAIQTLGLNEISEFDAKERIIEYKLKRAGRLVSMKIDEFADELASESPAPGGGSVAALNGALSASLSAMVGNLTFGKKKYKDVKQDMIDASVRGQELKKFFLDAIDRDTDAFNKIMDGFAMPKKTDSEKAIRDIAILEATKEATLIPLSVLKKTKEAAEIALITAEKGNQNSLSDAGVAGLTAESAAEGAYYNVMINLEGIRDEEFTQKVKNEAASTLKEVKLITEKVRKLLY